jgi:hypothetical protein
MALTGVVTVSTAGTQIQGSANGPGTYAISPDPANAGAYGYVGDDSVGSSTGYKMANGDVLIITVGNLSNLWFDVTTSGDKFTWIKIGGEHVGNNPPAV